MYYARSSSLISHSEGTQHSPIPTWCLKMILFDIIDTFLSLVFSCLFHYYLIHHAFYNGIKIIHRLFVSFRSHDHVSKRFRVE
jgi:hypothetical protein